MRKRKTALTFATLSLLCLAAMPQARADHHEGEHAERDLPTFGVAVIRPTKGNKTRGVLRLTQEGDVLRIQGRINNLTPGEHGFHVHQYGDARGPDGTSAGGHYDPQGHEHGAPGPQSHAGDLGNITANENGVARVDIRTEDTKLHFLLGRSFIVHAGKDDLTSQPSGDAGPRVGIGVIGIGNPDYQPPRRGSN